MDKCQLTQDHMTDVIEYPEVQLILRPFEFLYYIKMNGVWKLIIQYIKSIIFPIWWVLKSWFWYIPWRIVGELWKYGYILSWDERTDRGGILLRRLAKWRNEYSRRWWNRRC